MKNHSSRFQTARLTFPSSGSKNFRPENSPFEETKFTDIPIEKNKQKQSLAERISAFYALVITCFCFIRKCLQAIICICQKQRQQDDQKQNRNARIPLKSSLSSEGLFSSDDDDDGCLDDLGARRGAQLSHPDNDCLSESACALAVDDYELPLVRLIDNTIYFINLYCKNSPAFRQEFLNALHNWACHSTTPLEYKNSFNPKEKRPKIIRKGIDFLKSRKLRAKMTRVCGDAHKRWVLQIALLSRLLIFFMQLILTNLPQDLKHKNDGFQFTPEDTYGKLLDGLVKRMFGGYINWDAYYFLHISVYGYTSENFLAFFPLLPMLLFIPSRILYFLLSSVISQSSIVVTVGVLFNIWLFLKCTDNIYELAKFRGVSNQFITTACMMFVFNPASIFFGGLYTETLFAYLTSSVILCLHKRQNRTSLVYAAISCLCRSNGILNVGFILALELQNELRNIKHIKLFRFILKSLIQLALSVVPFMMFQLYAVFAFCDYGKVYDDPAEAPLYCVRWAGMRSLPYSYVQKKYWNVGFLEYYQFKQIPNFILAAPVLYILGIESWKTFRLSVVRMLDEVNFQHIYRLFYGFHGLFLTFFCLFFVHVQVSTRMIMAACPYLYMYLAVSHEDEVENFRNRKINMPVRSLGITLWFILYYIIGTIGFSLGLPWT